MRAACSTPVAVHASHIRTINLLACLCRGRLLHLLPRLCLDALLHLLARLCRWVLFWLLGEVWHGPVQFESRLGGFGARMRLDYVSVHGEVNFEFDVIELFRDRIDTYSDSDHEGDDGRCG